jgi:two-component system sensor histidine kinase KdpD
VLGVVAYDFCFVPPYLTLGVHEQQYLVTFAVMLATALTISTLTHRVRQQTEAARQAWERAETEFLRNTLLSGVSHDLRTPLAAITGAASSLIETGDHLPPAARAEMLDTIYSEAERMERLIHNLLDMTRLESGGLVVRKEWQPLQEVVGSALRHLDRRLRGRPVKIDIPEGLPLVQIDAAAIEQVLVNLLENAVIHTPTGTGIDVRARDGDGEVVVEVSDRGPGLPPGTERRVFEKFFRASPPESRRGIGLGLAISRGIVEAHGGAITASNRDVGGAVFRFTLPRAGAAPVVDSSQ